MAEIVGRDPKNGKDIPCTNCPALIRYYPRDIEQIKVNWDFLGDYNIVNAIRCPQCNCFVRLN